MVGNGGYIAFLSFISAHFPFLRLLFHFPFATRVEKGEEWKEREQIKWKEKAINPPLPFPTARPTVVVFSFIFPVRYASLGAGAREKDVKR